MCSENLPSREKVPKMGVLAWADATLSALVIDSGR
jgi:hypothetical protein